MNPGTRCECRDYDCARMDEHNDQHRSYPNDACANDAVRMVTVREPVPTSPDAAHYAPAIRAFGGSYNIPMCAPCANFHERGSK